MSSPMLLSGQTPPPVVLQGEERKSIHTADGLVLEALVRAPVSHRRMIVLCHPHPLHQGTMHNAVIVALARAVRDLPGEPIGLVRFNFRGVGASTGQYNDVQGGVADTLAVIDWVSTEYGSRNLSVCGYSFGSAVALLASTMRQSVDRVALIAPAIHHFHYPDFETDLHPAVAILVGDGDSFVSVGEASNLAERLEARLHVLEEADHFFITRRRDVADWIVPFLVPESPVGKNSQGVR